MNKKGLTLIEIMISVLILLIISAGILSAFIGGHQLMNRSRHRLQALNFAREAIDTLRCNYTYGSSEMLEGAHDSVTDPAICASGNIIRDEMAALNSGILTYTVTLDLNGYKKLGVTIDWTEIAF
ncbi:MAG: type II secretion system GspH family protein [Candidatus Omnitrophica bacterium]|nr:type II secretion system GspH family protein [Candidatus Omnitrophota bacterium]MBU4590299.1 type II secretion system GspH family protein [Candidatus Omnitrophota bacterium]